MHTVTWRAEDTLVARVRSIAASRGLSLNEFLTRTLDAATNPELAGSDAQRTRERLAAAGLLVAPGPPRERPDPALVAAAAARAAEGTPVSDIVSADRE